MDPEVSVEDGLIENVLKELEDELIEKVHSKDMVDCACASDILNQINTKEEREIIKKEIAKALLVSSWTQRIYFVVRSLIMTIIGAITTLVIFWQLGTINVIGDFTLGIFLYLISLVVSRLFDKEIFNISKNILNNLGKSTSLRTFILGNF